MRFFSFLQDLLFPPVCLGCNAFGWVVCPQCQAKLTVHQEQICPSCLQVNSGGGKHTQCLGSVDGLTACWDYEAVLQKIIKEIKYRYYFSGIEVLAQVSFSIIQSQNQQAFSDFLTNAPIVVPVPLHKRRQNLRGFNQSGLLGKIYAQCWQLPFSDQLVQRNKNTQPQAELNKQQRQTNIKDAFLPTEKILKLGEKPLQGRGVLLVDDVWTTGSTMKACAEVLKQLGAEKIWALTLAR